jgi:signal transduction histidine kinase
MTFSSRFWLRSWSFLFGVGLLVAASFFALRLWPGLLVPSARLPLSDQDLYRVEAWKPLGGSWNAQPDEIDDRSEERGAKLIYRLGSWRDLDFEAQVQMTESDGETGLLLRASDEQEGVDAYRGYSIAIRAIDNTLEFGRSDFGWHSLARIALVAPMDPASWVNLRVIALGCDFHVEAMNSGRITSLNVHDPQCLRTGHIGLRSFKTSVRWKNLRVRAATSLPSPSAMQSQQQPPASIDSTILPNPSSYEAVYAAKARRRAILPGVQSIGQFQYVPGWHPNVTLQGMIISTAPLIDLQDDSSAMIISPRNPSLMLKRGDVVEAHGDVSTSRFRSELQNADIRVLWSDTPIPPLAVSASELSNGHYRGRTITIEGTLVSSRALSSGYELILKDREYLFRAVGSGVSQHPPADLQTGARLRLLGMATSLESFTGGTYPFAIVVDGFDILAPPPWWSLRHILWLLAFVLVLLAAVLFLMHKLQQWHTNSLLREREELAYEMHDTLAQSFAGIAYQLQAASLEKRGEGFIRFHIASALELVHHSHREASRTIAALRPQHGDADAILVSLREYVERLSESRPIEVEISLSGHNAKLPLRVTDALFRIGQEAISNAVQHSGCSQISLAMALHLHAAEFVIRDNGCGFEPDKVAHGLGLAGMKNRAARIHAQMEVSTGMGLGTLVTVRARWRLAWREPLRRIFS